MGVAEGLPLLGDSMLEETKRIIEDAKIKKLKEVVEEWAGKVATLKIDVNVLTLRQLIEKEPTTSKAVLERLTGAKNDLVGAEQILREAVTLYEETMAGVVQNGNDN